MRRFSIPSQAITQDRAQLSGAEFHHLRHVLRLGRGARITLYDERGATYHGEILRIAPTYAEISITKHQSAAPSSLHLTLAQGTLKGRKMDLVIEKATELGVHVIAPFVSAFTVARIPDGKRAERTARWQHIARAAAKQSGSPPPEIRPPRSFPEFLHSVPTPSGKLIFSERERTLHLREFAQHATQFDSLHILVGPEGGFAPEEIQQAQATGFVSVSLGASVLRAETASITAVALCQFLWHDIRSPLP
jgi:16S rRNA (uracil1498-N3)-methyltransferase